MAIVADRKLLATGQECDVQFGLADIDTEPFLYSRSSVSDSPT